MTGSDRRIFDKKEDDGGRFIPNFSAHPKCKGNITLSAYGSSSYALVFDQRLLKIYDPNTRSILGGYDLPERAGPTFSSVIANGDGFFLTTSNGSTLSCSKTTVGYNFVTKLVKNLKPEKLLGASSSWFAYQSTRKSIYRKTRRTLMFLKSDQHISGKSTSLETFEQEIEDEIVAHVCCSATGLLWVVTGVDQSYSLYKIDPNERTKEKFTINLEDSSSGATLLAVSNQGDVAFEADREIVIYQPWNQSEGPKRVEFDCGRRHVSEDEGCLFGHLRGHSCFANYHGSEYLIICGEEYAEILVAEKKDRDWQTKCFWQRYGTDTTTDFDFSTSGVGPVLTHPGLDNQGRLVFGVATSVSDDCGREHQGLLVSLSLRTGTAP